MTGKENLLWKLDRSMDCIPNRPSNGRNLGLLHHVKDRKDFFHFLEEMSIWITHNFKCLMERNWHRSLPCILNISVKNVRHTVFRTFY